MEREVKLKEIDLLEKDYTRLSDFCLTLPLIYSFCTLQIQWKNKKQPCFPLPIPQHLICFSLSVFLQCLEHKYL